MGFLGRLLGYSRKREKTGKKNPSGESRQPRNENAVKLLECGGFFALLLKQDKYIAKSRYREKREEYAPAIEFFSVLKSSGMLEDFCKKNGLLIEKAEQIMEVYNDIEKLVEKHNDDYTKNGTGCDKSIGMKYYYDQMGYTMEQGEAHPDVEKIQAPSRVPEKAEIPLEKPSIVNKKLTDDSVEIQRAVVKPVMFGEKDLNEVVFTILKALQNMSRNRFYGIKVLTDILIGTESEKVVKNNLGQIPEFRALSDMSYDTVQATIEWMIMQHLILKTKGRYPVLHPTYDGLHYSEFITESKLKKLKQYLEEDIILWK